MNDNTVWVVSEVTGARSEMLRIFAPTARASAEAYVEHMYKEYGYEKGTLEIDVWVVHE